LVSLVKRAGLRSNFEKEHTLKNKRKKKKKKKRRGLVINFKKFKLKNSRAKKSQKTQTHWKMIQIICRSAPVKIVVGVSEGSCDIVNMDVIYQELKQ